MQFEERKNKCVYCKNGNPATHFHCVRCGCGMCEDCYQDFTEHDFHYFDFHESIQDSGFYEFIVKRIETKYGYMCEDCMDELRTLFNIKKFKNLKEYRDYLLEKEVSEDLVMVNGIVFTLDFYDKKGKELTYKNKKHKKAFKVLTKNRYQYRYKDVKLEYFEPVWFRKDITYFE